jgi:hypothetical protein
LLLTSKPHATLTYAYPPGGRFGHDFNITYDYSRIRL